MSLNFRKFSRLMCVSIIAIWGGFEEASASLLGKRGERGYTDGEEHQTPSNRRRIGLSTKTSLKAGGPAPITGRAGPIILVEDPRAEVTKALAPDADSFHSCYPCAHKTKVYIPDVFYDLYQSCKDNKWEIAALRYFFQQDIYQPNLKHVKYLAGLLEEKSLIEGDIDKLAVDSDKITPLRDQLKGIKSVIGSLQHLIRVGLDPTDQTISGVMGLLGSKEYIPAYINPQAILAYGREAAKINTDEREDGITAVVALFDCHSQIYSPSAVLKLKSNT